VARAAVPSSALIVIATVPIGIGIALVGMALPGFVKEHFPRRPGAMTGVYVAALSVGAGVAAAGIIPVAHGLGGWRWAFALSVVPTAVAVPLWLMAPRSSGMERQSSDASLRPPAPRPASHLPPIPFGLTALLAVTFGCQSMSFAVTINWVATLFREAGYSAGAGALATSIIPLVTIPASLIVTPLSDRGDRRGWLLAMASLMALGTLALAIGLAPSPWLWLVLYSFGAGAMFPLCLTLPLDARETPAEVDRLSARMLGAGYVLSASGPVAVGALRDASGSFRLPFILLAGIAMIPGVLALAPALRRPPSSLYHPGASPPPTPPI
jgi:CP family cyanate transporter-like MFS transporter